jgi:hypothetical protein
MVGFVHVFFMLSSFSFKDHLIDLSPASYAIMAQD